MLSRVECYCERSDLVVNIKYLNGINYLQIANTYQCYIWESAAQLLTMASSSVSQEDVENDFEKLEKRSRIRTARARQINPQVSQTPTSNNVPI